jgi:hypothetical protein
MAITSQRGKTSLLMEEGGRGVSERKNRRAELVAARKGVVKEGLLADGVKGGEGEHGGCLDQAHLESVGRSNFHAVGKIAEEG